MFASRWHLNSGIRSGDLLIQDGIKSKDHKRESITEARILTIALDSTTGENIKDDKRDALRSLGEKRRYAQNCIVTRIVSSYTPVRTFWPALTLP